MQVVAKKLSTFNTELYNNFFKKMNLYNYCSEHFHHFYDISSRTMTFENCQLTIIHCKLDYNLDLDLDWLSNRLCIYQGSSSLVDKRDACYISVTRPCVLMILHLALNLPLSFLMKPKVWCKHFHHTHPCGMSGI